MAECLMLLNFSHPITDKQQADIEALAGMTIEQVVDIPVQVDTALPLVPQIVALVDSCALSAHDWQTLPIAINPPGLATAAVVLMAEIHGRRGGFPATVRLRPVTSGQITRYDVAEVINVQSVRDSARSRR